MTRILVWSRQAEQIQKSEKRGSTVSKSDKRDTAAPLTAHDIKLIAMLEPSRRADQASTAPDHKFPTKHAHN